MSPARLLRHGAGAPAWNMAVDEALMQLSPLPVLRLYAWSEAAVTLGYFQSWKVAPAGRPFIRRYTGGGLVDHTRDLTYTIVAPRSSDLGQLSTSESYALIHLAIALGLARMGLEAELTPCCVESEAAGCFDKPVKSDVLINGVKVAGAAQRRTRVAMLTQGSILLSDSGRHEELRALLPEVFAERLGWAWEVSEMSGAEEEMAIRLETERYGRDEWNRER